MKHKRMTIRREDGSATVYNTSLQGLIDRLAELEDKIERGELIERTSEEYSAVRKQAVEGFAEKLKSHVTLNYTMDGEFVEDINIWSLFKDIGDLVKEACGE